MVKWDIIEACNNVLQHFIDERNTATRCTICKTYLYNYETKIYNYLYKLEVIEKKIDRNMYDDIMNYVYSHYPYTKDKSLHNHHVNYMLNITIPLCATCHSRVHNSKDKRYEKYKPYDKKPKQ